MSTLQFISMVRQVLLLKIAVFWAAAATVVFADVRLDPVPDGWYSAYSKYPEYCSTPAMMASRKIPLLGDDLRLGETRLVHATVVIRHGARTPTNGGYTCWDTYWENQATGVWNCSLTVEMAPPTPMHLKQEEGSDGNGSSDTIVLFEKHYDALMDKEDGLSNDLYGTCQAGQLLLQGYEQEVVNGQHLREAYCYDSSSFDHDQRMRLLDLQPQGKQPWASPQLYFRTDDEQRTLLSGQALLRGMLQPELEEASKDGTHVRIPVHTADLDNDILGVNEDVCPRLKQMREKLEQSFTFGFFNQSSEAQKLRNFMLKDLGAPVEIDIIACLMTTVCTDRPLPEAFDYEGESDMFDRLITFENKRFNMHLLANEAEYSKLAMAPVWAEIMDHIDPILNQDDNHPPTRLALFSGHDDTIAPLLASLGAWKDTDWPPYASMMNIEIHEIIDGQSDRTVYESRFAFRLIYDGEVITHNVHGCLDDAELCDIKFFLDKVAPIATRERNCGNRGSIFTSWTQPGESHFSGPFYTLCMILIGAACGGIGVFFYLTGTIPWSRMRSRKTYTPSDELPSVSHDPPISYTDEPYRDDPGKNGNSMIN